MSERVGLVTVILFWRTNIQQLCSPAQATERGGEKTCFLGPWQTILKSGQYLRSILCRNRNPSESRFAPITCGIARCTCRSRSSVRLRRSAWSSSSERRQPCVRRVREYVAAPAVGNKQRQSFESMKREK
ncbi:hypothetical protein HDV57DRAFT_503038 [Trichoderma longibrachiatum]